MDLDTIKDIWDSESPGKTPEISLEQQNEIHLPLEKLRKNMRMEFKSSTIAFIIFILFITFADFHFLKFKIYTIALVASLILIKVFYYYKLFVLYKNLSSVDLNLVENLKNLRFEFKLNEQYYLAYYFALVPFAIAEIILIFEFIPGWRSLTGSTFTIYFFLFCIIMLVVLFFMVKWWFYKFYGKYFKQIIELIDNLK
jgi:hypothetical protein